MMALSTVPGLTVKRTEITPAEVEGSSLLDRYLLAFRATRALSKAFIEALVYPKNKGATYHFVVTVERVDRHLSIEDAAHPIDREFHDEDERQ